MTPEQASQLKELHAQRRVAPWTYQGNLDRDAWAILNSTWAKVDALDSVELTDAQIAVLADKLAAHPTLAERIAEQVAVKVAARLAN